MSSGAIGTFANSVNTNAGGGNGTNGLGISAADKLSNRFLKLLVAQLNNQNPLKPLKNSQITSQLAQINTVAGINKLNAQLAKINGEIDTTHRLQATSLIGRDVLVPGDAVRVGEDAAATPFGFDLARSAAEVDLTITDQSGNLLYESHLSDLSAGVHSFSWDGENPAKKPADPGIYHINIEATDSRGNRINAQPLTMGYVDGVVVANGNGGPKLDLGPVGLVSLDKVYRIVSN